MEVTQPLASNEELSTKQTLSLIGLAGVASLLLAVVPLVGVLNYPFRLLITIVHELGHGLTAIITGGDFIRFVVYPNGAGLAYTAGGWRFLVIPAGYLGAALFGAGLIMLGRSNRWSRVALALVGALMLFFSLRYGTPTIFAGQIGAGLLTTFSGMIFGGLFLFVALKASAKWIIFLLHFIAIQAGLTAFTDVIGLIGLSAQSDAVSMSELTYIPAFVWALLWAVVTLVFIGGAIWITWIAPARK